MRVLITGHRGVLGTRVREYLSRTQPEVCQLYLKSNLLEVTAVRNEIRQLGHIDMVIHLASVVAVKYVENHSNVARDINVGGTNALLEALHLNLQKPRIFFASSSHVYGLRDIAFCENDVCNPVNQYGVTKLAAEQVCQNFIDSHNNEIVIGRIFSMWDMLQQPPFLFPSLRKRFATENLNKDFKLFGALSLRDFQSAELIAIQCVELLLGSFSGIINIASRKAQSVSDFAQSIAPRELKIIPTGESNQIMADVSKLHGML